MNPLFRLTLALSLILSIFACTSSNENPAGPEGVEQDRVVDEGAGKLTTSC